MSRDTVSAGRCDPITLASRAVLVSRDTVSPLEPRRAFMTIEPHDLFPSREVPMMLVYVGPLQGVAGLPPQLVQASDPTRGVEHVYLNSTGSTYHRKGCPRLRPNATPKPLPAVLAAGKHKECRQCARLAPGGESVPS